MLNKILTIATLFIAILMVVAASPLWRILTLPETAPNPDPSHVHVDFAIWVHQQKLDFTASQYMTSLQDETSLNDAKPRKYVHLHDGNGHVIHVHKSGLTFRTFLQSVGKDLVSLKAGEWCLASVGKTSVCESGPMKLFVNGHAIQGDPGSYAFHDLDKIYLSDTNDAWLSGQEMARMTDDACLFSKTCPRRGTAPPENCIAGTSICQP